MSAAGCGAFGLDGAVSSRLRTASICADLSRRRNSQDAAVLAALIYIDREQPEPVFQVLTPFEAVGDPRVLYNLAWAESRKGNRKLALEEHRRAFEASQRVADIRIRANATTLYAFELYRASAYEDAVRILSGLLQMPAGTLDLEYERDARLNMGRSLFRMGDAPAAEAELQRLKGILGVLPPSALELSLDASLHITAGQLSSANELLEEAQRAAQREADRSYEAGALMEQLDIAAKEADWTRVRARSVEIASFKDVLEPDQQRDLAVVNGIAARAEDRAEESRDFFEQALALAPPPSELWKIEYELGLTLSALGRTSEARAAFERSIADVEIERKRMLDPSLQTALIGSRHAPYDALFERLAEAGEAESALAILQRSLASRLADQVAEASSSAGHEVGDVLERSAAARKLNEANSGLPTRRESGADRDARFVAFVTTEAHSWALIHSGGRVGVVPVELVPTEFCALMQKFGEDFDDQAATRLGSALFPPSTLAQLGPRFAIILPACARSFPVAAVRIGDARLVDRAVVTVAPDVSTITRPASDDPGAAARSSLALADPFGDLSSAREEVESAHRLTGADIRLGHFASGATLEQAGGRLLHFATHTVVDVAGPALVLADSKLSVADVLRRRLHADLVVLASCHSGSGLAATAADTLSTAFLRAGSGAVLATLRSVEDRFASDVIRAFYEQGGLDDPAGALARVQRQLARTEPPSRWSAFFVAGSPEPGPRVAAPHRAQAAYGG